MAKAAVLSKPDKKPKAVLIVHPSNGDDEFMWTLMLNGRPYAQAPVTYTRRAAATDSAHRFADMLAFNALVITQDAALDA